MIKIVAFGNFKKNSLKNIYYDYEKRIKRYLKIELLEIKEIPIKKANFIDTALKKEEIILEEILKKEKRVYLLSEHGTNIETLDFKKKIYKDLENFGNICFVLGSSHGFTKNLLKKYPKISLSKMTFPHLLARVMLIEQIYRAVTIENNINYHK